MTGIDIFVAIICAVMFFGGMFLNIRSRKLANEYIAAHRAETVSAKSPEQKPGKNQKK